MAFVCKNSAVYCLCDCGLFTLVIHATDVLMCLWQMALWRLLRQKPERQLMHFLNTLDGLLSSYLGLFNRVAMQNITNYCTFDIILHFSFYYLHHAYHGRVMP